MKGNRSYYSGWPCHCEVRGHELRPSGQREFRHETTGHTQALVKLTGNILLREFGNQEI